MMVNQNLVFFLRLSPMDTEILYQLRTMNNKQIKLCETNPIFKTSEMNVSPYSIITMNKKQRTMNYQKRTQTNPISKGKRGYLLFNASDVEACAGIDADELALLDKRGHLHD